MKQIRLSKSSISKLECEAVERIMKDEFLGMGPETRLFESELSNYFSRYVSVVNTGTSAIQLCLEALGIGLGDEVIVPSLTYLASFQAISATGATPIAVDVSPETGNMCIKSALQHLTDRSKAVLWVHYAGDPSGFEEAVNEFSNRGIYIVEDAAHAFGSKQYGKLVGTLHRYACFSFDGIKNITAGEGGAIVTNDLEVKGYVDDARLLGVTGDTLNRYVQRRTWEPKVSIQGWRYHMSDLNAAIGRVQLGRSTEFFRKRQKTAKKYDKLLENHCSIVPFLRDYNEVVPHIYPVRVRHGKRDELKEFLENKNIQCGIHYYPNHLLEKFGANYALNNTENLYSELLTLPLHYDLNNDQVEYIVTMVEKFLRS